MIRCAGSRLVLGDVEWFHLVVDKEMPHWFCTTLGTTRGQSLLKLSYKCVVWPLRSWCIRHLLNIVRPTGAETCNILSLLTSDCGHRCCHGTHQLEGGGGGNPRGSPHPN